MMNNNLIPYKENIFTKILNYFKKKFSKNKSLFIKNNEEENFLNNQYKNKKSFLEDIVIKENEEEKRIKNLQLQYDNGEIDEEDISDEDMDKLIEMYEKETEELNKETEKIKCHIAKMLKEFKKS